MFFLIFRIFRPIEKIASDGPKWGQEDLFPTNPDLVDILGRTDLDFANSDVLECLNPKFPDLQVPDFPISRNLAWAGPSLAPRGWAPQG